MKTIVASIMSAIRILTPKVKCPPPLAISDWSSLVGQLLGDRGAANRLTEYEMRRDPFLSREAAISRALWRLQYDRSR